MVKGMTGLPGGYDLKVTSSELISGPATLPGYLDDKPAFVRPVQPKVEVKEEVKNIDRVTSPVSQVTEKSEPVITAPAKVEMPQVQKKPRAKVCRLQINITPEVEKKAEELVRLIGMQSPDGKVMISEIVQALIINLYDARHDLNAGQLPVRGKWGSPTARSFPAALSQALKEAMTSSANKAGNPFKKVVGA